MMNPEGPEELTKIREFMARIIVTINMVPMTNRDEKVMAVREAMILMGIPWDQDEGPLWAEILKYVQDGGELTDAYLIAWRRRYREVLGLG